MATKEPRRKAHKISYEEALANLDGVERREGHAMALSPFRQETEPSLRLSPRSDGGFLAYDHGNPDWNHEDFHKLIQLIRDRMGDGDSDKPPPPPAKPKPQPRKATPKPSKGKPSKKDSGPPWETAAVYPYVDERGVKLYEAVRQERTTADGKRQKKFSCRHEKNGRLTYNLTGCRRILYHLDEIVARPGEPVWICEGEKCTDAVRELGLLATCNPLGAGKWLPEYSKSLAGRDVIILRDYDRAGESHAASVAADLYGKASQIRIPDLPGLEDQPSHGQDVYDWIHAHHHGKDDLLHALGEAAPWQPVQLSEVVSSVRELLHMPDITPLLAVLGVCAANRMDGPAVWLLLVAPPACGKSELLGGLRDLPEAQSVGVITEAGLLSGAPSKKWAKGAKGGLLREIEEMPGSCGLIVAKDFGSILSMNRDARATVLAALREIYDGSWTRILGHEGGQVLEWSGKVGLIGGTTAEIDKYYSVLAKLGDRFILCRLDESHRLENVRQAIARAGIRARDRSRMAEIIGRFFAHLELPADPCPLEDDELERLCRLADVVTRARSPVDRDGYSHERSGETSTEQPTRFGEELAIMLQGLLAVGLPREEAWRVLRRLARDSIAPPTRRKALDILYRNSRDDGWMMSRAVQDALDSPRRITLQALEDLMCHGVVERREEGRPEQPWYSWRMTEYARANYPEPAETR